MLEDEVNSFYYHELTNVVSGIKASSKLGKPYPYGIGTIYLTLLKDTGDWSPFTT